MRIYVHIPFCRKACHYCDFHFSTKTGYTDAMTDAICREIELRGKKQQDNGVASLYFGGGTPSVLSGIQLQKIMEALNREFEIQSDAEITLEANPDDLNETYLETLNAVGINRLSIGVQSFREEDLTLINRSHNALQAVEAIEKAKNKGINNISIDLIYGIPGSSAKVWEANLGKAVELGVQHISCYSLTIEQGTVFGHMVHTGSLEPVPDSNYESQYEAACNVLKQHGYAHYEVSNFALDGFQAQHNSAYWTGEKYIGFGPGAHSYDGQSRRWNISNNRLYMKGLQDDEIPFETEVLSDKDRLNEKLMTGLRTACGISPEEVFNMAGSQHKELEKRIEDLIGKGQLIQLETRIVIPEPLLYVSDSIISSLFI